MDVRFNLERGETSAEVICFSLQAQDDYYISSLDSGLAAGASPIDIRLAIYERMLNHEAKEVRCAGVAVIGQMSHHINQGEMTLTPQQRVSFSALVDRARQRYGESSNSYKRAAYPIKKMLDTYYVKNNLRPDKMHLMGLALAYGLSAVPSQTFNPLAVDMTHMVDLGGTMLKSAGVVLGSSMALAIVSQKYQRSKLGAVAQKALQGIEPAVKLFWNTLAGVGLIYVAAAGFGAEPQESRPHEQLPPQKAPLHLHIAK